MSEKLPKVGVGVFVFRDGKFLMGKRKGSHGANSWSIPGGHLEWGESPEKTALREVKEEVGLDVTNPRFGAVTNDFFEEEGKHYLTVWIITDAPKDQEPFIAEPYKLVELEWKTFDELPRPLFLPWENLLKSEFIENIKNRVQQT